jgi:hypothetical protein
MSQWYLQLVHEAFTDPSGTCRVLVATSGQSVVLSSHCDHRNYTQADIPQGVDFPDVKIVCTVGLPGTMVDILQHAVDVPFVTQMTMPFLLSSMSLGCMTSLWKSIAKAT